MAFHSQTDTFIKTLRETFHHLRQKVYVITQEDVMTNIKYAKAGSLVFNPVASFIHLALSLFTPLCQH